MIRTFAEHHVRRNEALSNKLWDFTPSAGEHAGKHYQLMVPGCWESHMDFARYRGKAVYTTQFEAKENVRLVFKGVSHTANVSVDGNFVKTHYNAYTPFDVILPNLPAGTHTLTVEVDNNFCEESALHIPNDYMTYGGITRGVQLQEVPDCYIKAVHFTPYQKDNCWFAAVKLFIENLSGAPINVDLGFTLNKKSYAFSAQTIAAASTHTIEEEFAFPDVMEWMMETPNLYLLHATLVYGGVCHDDLVEQVGFREITLDGKRILINSKQIRIKGFNRHEDHPQFGCSIPYAAMVSDLYLIKDLGANSIRTAHYPNDELFLDLCDENGILVWEEHHSRGLEEAQMKHPNFDKQCADCIDEMIFSHYNHPCIYIWGILNECASDTEFGAQCYAQQYKQIEQLDTSRAMSSASNKHYRDLCFSYPTVVSNNFYPLWYFEVPVDEMLDKLMTYAQEHGGENKPYLVTEIGSGGIYGYRNRHKDKWTEECQADLLRKQITPILEKKDCTGVYVWQLCDVRVSIEWAMNRPRTMNNKGIVDEYRREKLAYSVVKELFDSYGNYFD